MRRRRQDSAAARKERVDRLNQLVMRQNMLYDLFQETRKARERLEEEMFSFGDPASEALEELYREREGGEN